MNDQDPRCLFHGKDAGRRWYGLVREHGHSRALRILAQQHAEWEQEQQRLEENSDAKPR